MLAFDESKNVTNTAKSFLFICGVNAKPEMTEN